MAATAEQFLTKELRARKDMDVRPGDTVRVHVKIEEKGKTRTQIFEGLVLARKHGTENGGTITVRKMSNGIGVERVFPLYAPMIDKIEVVKRSRVRRSKLYYIRTKVAREVRRKMRNFVQFFASSDDLEIPAEEMMDEIPEEVETTDAEGAETAEATNEAPAETTEAAPEETPAEEAKEEPAEAPEETSSDDSADSEEAPAEESNEEAASDAEEKKEDE